MLVCYALIISGGARLLSLHSPLVDVLSHFGFYKIAEMMRMDPALAELPFRRMTEINSSSSGGLDEFVAYEPTMGLVRGYLASRVNRVTLQELSDGPVIPVLASAVDVKWLRNVARKANFDVQREYRWYCDVFNEDDGFSSDVPAVVVDYFTYIFAQEVLWNTDGGCSFLEDDCFALLQLCSSILRLLWIQAPNLQTSYGISLIDIFSSCAATTEARRAVERKKVFVSAGPQSAGIGLNSVFRLRKESLFQISIRHS